MVKVPDPSFAPASGSFSARGAKKDVVVQPLRVPGHRTRRSRECYEDEDDAAVGAVVLEDPFREHRAVAGAAPEHTVEADIDAHLVIERVPGVRTPGMRASGAFESAQIVGVTEAVVAAGVCAEAGIVLLGAKRERGAALPSANHLRAE